MDYKTKIKIAEEVAEQLQDKVSLETIKSELKSKGHYEYDISNIIASSEKILGEKYSSKIQDYILRDINVFEVDEFKKLDNKVLDAIVDEEYKQLALKEKSKITQLFNKGVQPDQIKSHVDTRFLSLDEANKQIQKLIASSEEELDTHVSFPGLSAIFGVALIAGTWLIYTNTGRLYYVLPFVGLGLIIKSIVTMFKQK